MIYFFKEPMEIFTGPKGRWRPGGMNLYKRLKNTSRPAIAELQTGFLKNKTP
jgi:hypothetical protein